MPISTQTPSGQMVCDELGTLGGRLRAVRHARGLRLGALARELGISRTSLGGWESNSVKNPDLNKLISFSKMADVSLQWLIERSGPDPDLRPTTTAASSPTNGGGETDGKADGHNKMDGFHVASPADGAAMIPEISASMAAHARSFDMTAGAYWGLPDTVTMLAFNGTPGRMVIKREVSQDPSLGAKRGDYLLIDTSRTRIDEVGLYLLADPDGKQARRARVTVSEDGSLLISDDINRVARPLSSADDCVLGRVMAIFQPV